MIYWLIFITLLLISISKLGHESDKKIFIIFFIILLIQTTLRKGQGSDYYNYEVVYREIKELANQNFVYIFTRTEPLFAILNYLAIKLNLSFTIFSVLVSACTMLLLMNFFSKICKYSVISLFIFYSVFFLIYFYSTLRQGISMAIFASYALPAIYNRNLFKFILICIICGLFHASAFILIFLSIIPIKLATKDKLIFLILISIIISIVNMRGIPLPSIISNRLDVYDAKATIVSIFSRIILVLPILIIPKHMYKVGNMEFKTNALILSLGFFVFCFFSFSLLSASRIGAYFFIVICPFINSISENIKNISLSGKKIISSSLIIIYCIINFPKDITGFISQGAYQNCNVLTYPYLNLFDSDQEISHFRKDLGFGNH